VTIDEVLQLYRYAAAFKPEAAQYFLRDGVANIFGPVGIGIEHHHAQRIAVLLAHQVADVVS
jgi:hypothetical protein